MATRGSFRRAAQALRRLGVCSAGGVLIYIAFGLPTLLGAMALSIDLGRSFILNTELKDYSDAAALAGAAELDGRQNAILRAYNAATTGISGNLINIQAFATDGGGPNLQVAEVVFLKNLPADGSNFTAADTTTVDTQARFIFVKVVDRSVRSGLSRALGLIPDFQTSARSIAGFSAVHCRIPAMMMCNPLEDDETPFPIAGQTGCLSTDLGVGKPLKSDCLKGRQMLLKTAGNGANYIPGNVGLLDTPDGCQGTNCVAPYVASAEPGLCVAASANFRTGQAMGSIRTAINTRFDMYENPKFKGEEDNAAYRPALNVVKGHTGDPCDTTAVDPPVAMAYPKDQCFVDGNCPGNGRFGMGNWQAQAQAYWDINHPSGVPANPLIANPDMSRYDLYRYEIENLIIPNNSPAGEDAHPTCYNAGVFSDPTMAQFVGDDGPNTIDRRVFTLAAVNCRAEGPLQGNESNVPVIGFVDVFLTGPAEGTGNDKADIYGEIIGVSTPGVNGLKDIVQLYR